MPRGVEGDLHRYAVVGGDQPLLELAEEATGIVGVPGAVWPFGLRRGLPQAICSLCSPDVSRTKIGHEDDLPFHTGVADLRRHARLGSHACGRSGCNCVLRRSGPSARCGRNGLQRANQRAPRIDRTRSQPAYASQLCQRGSAAAPVGPTELGRPTPRGRGGHDGSGRRRDMGRGRMSRRVRRRFGNATDDGARRRCGRGDRSRNRCDCFARKTLTDRGREAGIL